MSTLPLDGIRVVCLGVNLPAPVAAQRLAKLGASVTKVEPPMGDPLRQASPEWYERLTTGILIVKLDLKSPEGIAEAHVLIDDANVLLTSYRPAALARLGLHWEAVNERHPRLSQVAIVGQSGVLADRPGHDLIYQVESGLISGAEMPRSLYADLVGAERAVTETLAAVIDQQMHGHSSYREVALADVTFDLAEPWRIGITRPEGVLGGATPVYGIYESADGHIALAAIEPRFYERLATLLNVELTHVELAAAFAGRTSAEWAAWADGNDLPLAVIG